MSQSLVRLRSVAEAADDIARAWLEYGRDYAKHPSLWDSSLAFASGPLRPEGATLLDYSGRTAGAAWSVGVGDVPKYTQGSVRGGSFLAGQFDGSNDYANCGNVVDFTNASQFSIAFVVRRIGINAYRELVAKKRTTDPYTGYAIAFAANNKIQVTLEQTSTSRIMQTTASAFLDTSVYYHIAVTHNGAGNASGISVYVDGTLQAKDAATQDNLAGSIANSANFTIGARSDADGILVPTNSLLCNVRIYRRVLTPAEIAVFARHPLEAFRVEVPKYWSFAPPGGTHLWPWQIRHSRRVRGHR